MRGVTLRTSIRASSFAFQLTRLMRGVTYFDSYVIREHVISTHTPHARRDLKSGEMPLGMDVISTHTPHARRDTCNNLEN